MASLSSENPKWKPYKNGKTELLAFIDDGQWFMLLRDAKEYAEGSDFTNILCDFINQLKPRNVFPSSFDYELKFEEFKNKLVKLPDKNIFADEYFKMLDLRKSDLKFKDIEDFRSFTTCGICLKVLNAEKRQGNKICQVCNFNCCEECFEKLPENKKCPIGCQENAFINMNVVSFSLFDKLSFKCGKCKISFKTAKFQGHFKDENSSCFSEV